MVTSDWVAGLALACFLGPCCGAVAALVASLGDKPSTEDINGPLVSPRDIRRCLVCSLVFTVVLTPMLAMLFRADRQDAESWQTFTREHKCIAVETRTITEYRLNPATKMNESYTVTEYLWRCDNGEQWHR